MVAGWLVTAWLAAQPAPLMLEEPVPSTAHLAPEQARRRAFVSRAWRQVVGMPGGMLLAEFGGAQFSRVGVVDGAEDRVALHRWVAWAPDSGARVRLVVAVVKDWTQRGLAGGGLVACAGLPGGWCLGSLTACVPLTAAELVWRAQGAGGLVLMPLLVALPAVLGMPVAALGGLLGYGLCVRPLILGVDTVVPAADSILVTHVVQAHNLALAQELELDVGELDPAFFPRGL